jgi:hypothetical protein
MQVPYARHIYVGNLCWEPVVGVRAYAPYPTKQWGGAGIPV